MFHFHKLFIAALLFAAQAASAGDSVFVQRLTYTGPVTVPSGYDNVPPTTYETFLDETGDLHCNGRFVVRSSISRQIDPSGVDAPSIADGKQFDGLFLATQSTLETAGAPCFKPLGPFYRATRGPTLAFFAVGPLPPAQVALNASGGTISIVATRPAMRNTTLVLRFVGAKRNRDFKAPVRVRLLKGNVSAELRIMPKPKRKADSVTVSLKPSKKYQALGVPVVVPLQ